MIMRKSIWILCLALALQQCGTKKTETTATPTDSLAADSLVLATKPAPALLAFSPLEGFAVKTKMPLPDSVNYFLFFNQEEFNQKFTASKSASNPTPDFLINYVVAAAMKTSTQLTLIGLDSVSVANGSIDVYLHIQRGEQLNTPIIPSSVFAIERRDGYSTMQFFVNGKMDKGLVLVQ